MIEKNPRGCVRYFDGDEFFFWGGVFYLERFAFDVF